MTMLQKTQQMISEEQELSGSQCSLSDGRNNQNKMFNAPNNKEEYIMSSVLQEFIEPKTIFTVKHI